MASKDAINTPLMKQYLSIKKNYPDAILLFRLGDFYEMFFEDAIIASKILEITLTSRNKEDEVPIPMCGVPYHAVNNYIPKLLEEGYKVAICEQMEDPSKVKGLVKREVVQVITPGVVFEPESLESKSHNFLVALINYGGVWGLASLDVSTALFRFTVIQKIEELFVELNRIEPKELILPVFNKEIFENELKGKINKIHVEFINVEEKGLLSLSRIKSIIGENLNTLIKEWEIPGIMASELALLYIKETQKDAPLPIERLTPYRITDYMILDDTTKKHLELFKSLSGDKKSSFISNIDYTITPMGGRLLKEWISYPLLDPEKIKERQNKIEFFKERPILRKKLRDILKSIGDIERITTRINVGIATPRDLGQLRNWLRAIPTLIDLQSEEEIIKEKKSIGSLFNIRFDTELYEKLEGALVENPPISYKEGGIFKIGYNKDLDELIELATKGKDYIQQYEQKEREKTGIASLKIRYNKVFGYYIEITKPNLKYVPQHYIRKQTLANAERFTTEELELYESKILTAQERREALEQQLFLELREFVSRKADYLYDLAQKIALLDLSSAIGELSHERGYSRPHIEKGKIIEIKEGRHPVVELFLPTGKFVPNDTYMDEKEFLMIITGPNMSGKSTIMRQVALIIIMAQAGLFVPAKSARIGVVDRVFTRVGASDNLALGQSTFMTEMQETATILKEATPESFVILDEIGRGTSTYDGMSIAWAVVEYLHDVIGCRTMFATHYHELTELAKKHQGIVNYNVVAKEFGGKVLFLHKLERGVTNRSYGIEVARLAGIPEKVIKKAIEVLTNLENINITKEKAKRVGNNILKNQLSLFITNEPTIREVVKVVTRESPILAELREIDINRITPLEALNLLANLVEKAKKNSGE